MTATRQGADTEESDTEIAYVVHDAAVGPILVATTTAGIVRVAFAQVEAPEDVLEALARDLSARIVQSTPRLDPVRQELDEYFDGTRRAFGVPLDLRLARGFRREVVQVLAHVPWGTTVSYRDLATSAGRPRAVRAAASACAANPLPILVPCHRVIRSDGSLGGYLGGLELKRSLLALESSGA